MDRTFKLAVLMLATALMTLTAGAHATTYYISPNGNDQASGRSPGTAFRDFYVADEHLQPGDTLLFMPGTYPSFAITHWGTPTKWITFNAAVPSNRPIIRGSQYDPAIYVTAGFILLYNFDVSSGTNSVAAALQIQNTEHVRVTWVTAHDSGGGGILAIGSDYIAIYDNVVYNNSYTASNQTSGISIGFARNFSLTPGIHNIIANNYSYDNIDLVKVPGTNYTTDGNGIIIDTLDAYGPFVGETQVYNNVVHFNGGSGIRVYHSSNVYVTNNTVSGNLKSNTIQRPAGEIENQWGANNYFRNNVVQVISSTGYSVVDESSSNSIYDYNLLYGGGSCCYLYATNSQFLPASFYGPSPRFVSSGDYLVEPGSPVLGRAEAAIAPTYDIRGVKRPTSHVDLGAYQQSQ